MMKNALTATIATLTLITGCTTGNVADQKCGYLEKRLSEANIQVDKTFARSEEALKAGDHNLSGTITDQVNAVMDERNLITNEYRAECAADRVQNFFNGEIAAHEIRTGQKVGH